MRWEAWVGAPAEPMVGYPYRFWKCAYTELCVVYISEPFSLARWVLDGGRGACTAAQSFQVPMAVPMAGGGH